MMSRKEFLSIKKSNEKQKPRHSATDEDEVNTPKKEKKF
jgi:hypothetical protein